jgi:hypothetical protein
MATAGKVISASCWSEQPHSLRHVSDTLEICLKNLANSETVLHSYRTQEEAMSQSDSVRVPINGLDLAPALPDRLSIRTALPLIAAASILLWLAILAGFFWLIG